MNHMLKTTLSWRCYLDVPFPTVRETFQRLDVLHTLPLLSIVESNQGLRWLCRGIPISAPSATPFLPSLNSHLTTSHRTLSNTFSFITDAIGDSTTIIPFPAAMIPQTRLVLYMTTQTGAIRGFQRGEHIRRRHKRWTDLRRIRPEHLLDCSNRTGSGHSPEKGRFLGGTARGSNKVPSKCSSRNGNGQRGNGAMDVKEGNVHTFVPNAILAGFAALLA